MKRTKVPSEILQNRMNTIGPTPDPISIFTITSIIRYNALELKRYPRNNFESTPLKLSMNIWLTRRKLIARLNR